MKLLTASIHGFGKFYQKTFSFQDGIHILYGPNEAGKSTLHTFIGCMLFGLERGRGRAAKSDLYSRYLPWKHDASYGGSLAFESDDEICLLERSFRSDSRTCRFTAPDQGSVLCRDNTLPETYYEGLTESLYYNTISVRQLGSAADASLAEELARRLSRFHHAGTDAIDYPAAAAWLRAERKRQEALLDPTLEQRILLLREEASRLKTALEDTAFYEEKEALEQQLNDCMEQLTGHIPGRSDEIDSHEEGIGRHRSSGHNGFKSLPVFFFLLTAIFLWLMNQTRPAAAAAGAALLTAVLLYRNRHRRSQASVGSDSDAEPFSDDEFVDDEPFDDWNNSAEADPDENASSVPLQELRLRIQALQQQYQQACRKEWEYDQLLERFHAVTEEQESLSEQAVHEQEIRLEIQAVSLALSTLQRLAEQRKDSFGPHLDDTMSQILSGLTGGVYRQVSVDNRLNVSIRAQNRTISLDSLSRGTMEQIHLALRLAVIDLVFPQGGMPLLLDDCFLAYDDERLAQTLSWLAENYSGQIFIFTCQKREAALLKQERIPFTMISL